MSTGAALHSGRDFATTRLAPEAALPSAVMQPYCLLVTHSAWQRHQTAYPRQRVLRPGQPAPLYGILLAGASARAWLPAPAWATRPLLPVLLVCLALATSAGPVRATTPPATAEGTPDAAVASTAPSTPPTPRGSPSAPALLGSAPDTARVPLDTVAWTAPLEAAVSAAVCALIAAPVQQVRVQEGDRVNRGDTLVLLDRADLRLAAARARLASQNRQSYLDRATRLHAQGGVSTQELETVRYEADVAQLRREQADLDLSRTVLRTPITGCVAACAAQVGQLPTVGHVLVVLVDPADLKADLYLPASYLDRIRLQQSVQAVPVAGTATGPGRSLTGRVTWVSPILDPHSGQGRVRILFAQAGRHHRPGTLVRVYFGEP